MISRLHAISAVATAAVTGSAILAVALAPAAHPGTPWVGNQAAVVLASYQQSTASWTQRTCAAESAYAAQPSKARLDTMITDSLHVPWHAAGSKYGLGSDVYELGGDVLAGKTQYVAKGEAYVSKDCAA